MSQECLLVIDMQSKFMVDKNESDVLRKLAVQERMVSDFVSRGDQVVYTIFDPYFFGWILPQLEPRTKEEVVVKEESDGFINSSLEYQVQGKSLHVVGCNLDCCVRYTVETALKRGHEVTLYQNGLLSRESSGWRTIKTLGHFALQKGIKVARY